MRVRETWDVGRPRMAFEYKGMRNLVMGSGVGRSGSVGSSLLGALALYVAGDWRASLELDPFGEAGG